jgi:hypothetical protein
MAELLLGGQEGCLRLLEVHLGYVLLIGSANLSSGRHQSSSISFASLNPSSIRSSGIGLAAHISSWRLNALSSSFAQPIT